MAKTNLGRVVPVFLGEYQQGKTYEFNHIVSYHEASWWHVGKSPTVDVPPENGDTWALVTPPVSDLTRVSKLATLSTNWTGTGPYTQSLSLTGILNTDSPHVGPVLDENKETALKQLESWNKVSFARAGDGEIVFTCLEEKPDTAVPIQIEVVR